MKLILLVCFVVTLFAATGCSGFKTRAGEWSVPGRPGTRSVQKREVATPNARAFHQSSNGFIAQHALADCQRVAESFNIEDPMIPRTVEVVYDVPCLHRHLSR